MGTQQVGQRRAAHPVRHGVLGGRSHQPVDGHHLGQQPCALIQSRLARNRIQLQAPPHLVTDIDGAGLSCLLDFDLIEDHAHRCGLESGCGVNNQADAGCTAQELAPSPSGARTFSSVSDPYPESNRPSKPLLHFAALKILLFPTFSGPAPPRRLTEETFISWFRTLREASSSISYRVLQVVVWSATRAGGGRGRRRLWSGHDLSGRWQSRARPTPALIRLACGEQCAESQAVLRSEPGLPGERDVCRDVPLRQIDRAQYVAPLSVGVTGLLSRGDGREARPNQLLECRQPRFVERRRGGLLDLIAECVRIIVDPGKQRSSRLVRIGAGSLTGFDPEADRILSELPETAARIVEFFGLRMASREESLTERDGPCRLHCGDLPDVGRDLLQAAYE